MAGFDDLIRGALEKHGSPTQERRQAIYQSSRQALERMLTQNTSLDAATASAQRTRLEQAISDVEKDYAPKVPPAVASVLVPPPIPAPVAKPTPPVAPGPPPIPAPIRSPAPVIKQAAAPMPKVESPKPPVPPVSIPAAPEIKAAAPAVPIPAAAPVVLPDHLEPQIGVEPGSARVETPTRLESYEGDVLKEKKSYAKLLLWTIILVGLGVAVWWAINFGPALLKQQFDGSVPNPARSIESGSFVPEGQEGWVSAFSPLDDSQNIDSAGRGTVEIFQDGNRNFARIASNPGSTRNNLRIKIPRGIMQTLKGKAATFELVIKNAAEKTHQFAVFCEFDEMGSCGRKRFKALKKVDSFIFDVLVNDADLPDNQEAYLSINTDLSSNGKPIDLYSVRIRSEP